MFSFLCYSNQQIDFTPKNRKRYAGNQRFGLESSAGVCIRKSWLKTLNNLSCFSVNVYIAFKGNKPK